MKLNFSSDRIVHLLLLIAISYIGTIALQYYFEASRMMSMGIAVTLTVQVNNIVNNFNKPEDVADDSCTDEKSGSKPSSKKKGKKK
jgi:hypothetical protein